jgi:hypothetical protein
MLPYFALLRNFFSQFLADFESICLLLGFKCLVLEKLKYTNALPWRLVALWRAEIKTKTIGAENVMYASLVKKL